MNERAGLTVVTWNAQGSQGMNVAAVAAQLRGLAPDLVLLQEVQRRQLGALRIALGASDARWRFKHWGVTLPAEGLGVLSMRPLSDVHAYALARRWQFWNWRRRIVLECGVAVDGRVIHVANVHLGAGVPQSERVRQARRLGARSPGATIIAGDLNAEPNSAELDTFSELGWCDAERTMHHGVARPSTNWSAGPRTEAPTQRLDYILVRDRVDIEHAYVPDDWQQWAKLSDHLPVVAQFFV